MDNSLFIFRKGFNMAYIFLYVDDIILTTSSDTLRRSIMDLLSSEFAMKDLSPLNYFLGKGVACVCCSVARPARDWVGCSCSNLLVFWLAGLLNAAALPLAQRLEEIKLVGPVALRCMYAIERYLQELKSDARNKGRPEASMCKNSMMSLENVGDEGLSSDDDEYIPHCEIEDNEDVPSLKVPITKPTLKCPSSKRRCRFDYLPKQQERQNNKRSNKRCSCGINFDLLKQKGITLNSSDLAQAFVYLVVDVEELFKEYLALKTVVASPSSDAGASIEVLHLEYEAKICDLHVELYKLRKEYNEVQLKKLGTKEHDLSDCLRHMNRLLVAQSTLNFLTSQPGNSQRYGLWN
uniref:DUF4218 domain-containing protein n=1 Tax=Chenopodium quinoa TaxID=63459 RepID=A0A803L2S4_CHEQI